jgi:hypothetical protein
MNKLNNIACIILKKKNNSRPQKISTKFVREVREKFFLDQRKKSPGGNLSFRCFNIISHNTVKPYSPRLPLSYDDPGEIICAQNSPRQTFIFHLLYFPFNLSLSPPFTHITWLYISPLRMNDLWIEASEMDCIKNILDVRA